jgi:hypothetical protein
MAVLHRLAARPPLSLLQITLVLAVLLAAAGSALAQPFRLGDRPPTPEEQAYLDEHVVEVTTVKPNALSVARALAEGFRVGSASADGAQPRPAPLPSAVDNSLLEYFPPIRSQGGQGSCTCWAACYYYGTFTQARDAGVDVSGGNNDYILSPAFMYPLINGGHDDGASTSHAVSRMIDIGCCSWSTKPYHDYDYLSWPSEAAWIEALDWRMLTPHTLDGGTEAGQDSLKQYLANGHVVATRFSVYQNFGHYPNDAPGIDNRVYYARDGDSGGGHAVTIIGYDDNKSYVDHRDGLTHYGAFLLANSWGSDWGWYNSTNYGSKGFLWVAYEMFLERKFGPYVYYNDDRPDYVPTFYAVTGINHEQRGTVLYSGGIGSPSSVDFAGPDPLYRNGGNEEAITDYKRVAVDLTDGTFLIEEGVPTPVFTKVDIASWTTFNGTVTSADFVHDIDGDGNYCVVPSPDPPLVIPPGEKDYATLQLVWPLYIYVDGANTGGPWDGTPEHPYQTIQDGIDNAPTGVFVHVLPGIYNEGLDLLTGTHLTSSGAPVTIIDTLNSDEAVYADGVANAVIDGFTIVAGPDYHAVRSTNDTTLTLRRCVLTASKNGCGANGGGRAVLENCLVADNAVSGLWCDAATSLDLANCTVCNNGSYGIARWGSGLARITMCDTIVYGNGDDVAGDAAGYAVSYTDIGDGDFAGSDGNITADPQFVAGIDHNYYLSQTAAGQGSNSPCVDAGSDTVENLGLDGTTTRTDAVPDAGIVDMGYHATPWLVIRSITKAGGSVTIEWTARPGTSYVVEWSVDHFIWNEVPVGETGSWIDHDCAAYGHKYYRVREDIPE